MIPDFDMYFRNLANSFANRAVQGFDEAARLRGEADEQLRQMEGFNTPAAIQGARRRADVAIDAIKARAARDTARAEHLDGGYFVASQADLIDTEFVRAYQPIIAQAMLANRFVQDDTLGQG